jgi:hypothetical protein
MPARLSWVGGGVLLAAGLCQGQSTQGLISGRVVDSLSGKPVAAAAILCASADSSVSRTAAADDSGYYAVPLLSPGRYRLRVTAGGFQALELNELELPVGGELRVPIQLRPLNDVWEQNQHRSVFLPGNSVLQFYGPDVDPSRSGNFEPNLGSRGALESTVSEVIQDAALRDLPLAGRDAYALLALLPGVTTDVGTARGLGLSVNGQRPSASNFLLDGLENNNYLITGPLTTVAPEAVQEYRVSTNNYSAEYGRTSGFLANAVTRTGGDEWHGMGWFYCKNDLLDANDFQRNRLGLARLPIKEDQPGGSIAGPLRAGRLFASGYFEYARFRSAGDPLLYTLPSTEFQAPAGSLAVQLMQGYQAPAATSPSVQSWIAQPAELNQYLGLPRLDYVFANGKQRIFARAAIADLERPDFIWSPYPRFSSPLTQWSASPGGSWLAALTPNTTNEVRFGWSMDELRFDRAQPDIPTLASADGVTLPGSPAFYGYRNRTRSAEWVDNVVLIRHRHALKFGAGGLFRRLDGYLSAGDGGYYKFRSLDDFAAGTPYLIRVALSRSAFQADAYTPPDYNRAYRYNQWFGFAQDSFRVTGRFLLNYGVRYENFGSPAGTGSAKDTILEIGSGASLADRLAGATLVPGSGGTQQLYPADNNDWAARLGFSYSLRSNGRTMIRGGYGTYYDRPFDNLWQNIRNNSMVLATSFFAGAMIVPVTGALPLLHNLEADRTFTRINLFDANLRSPRIHSYFLGLQHQAARSLVVEVNGLGSLGRGLISTDVVNRDYSVAPVPLENPFGNFNPSLPAVYYRANQGFSDYSALSVSARYRAGRGQFYAAYTWSHSIDNQSDPLAGDFYDLLPSRPGAAPPASLPAAFSEQFNNRIDRGNSDFDQRHNLVFYSIWDLPSAGRGSNGVLSLLTRDWKFAQVAAIRSGFPYTVISGYTGSIFDGPPILNRRADLTDPAALYTGLSPVDGGRQIVSALAFQPSNVRVQGTSGRNAFSGPGLYSLDISLSRSFDVPQLGESGRITVRADAFNALNHANLGNPNWVLGSHFGEALYGRREGAPAFPALTPFDEAGRQIQLLVRLDF